MYVSMFYFALYLELSRELQQSEFIILSSLCYLPSKNSNMKQLTPTHHRNYLEVEHKSTGRCTPFAPRHPKEKSKAGPVQAWTIQWWIERTTITGNNWIKVNYIWVLCLHLFFMYRSISPPSQGPFKDIYIRCVPVLTKTIAAQERKKLRSDRSDIEREWCKPRRISSDFLR